jgi:hypothetical protein
VSTGLAPKVLPAQTQERKEPDEKEQKTTSKRAAKNRG